LTLHPNIVVSTWLALIAVSHIDSVYRVYSFFNDNQEQIPQFNIVIADEYQDFNKLEAGLIELFSKKNKTLLAGDDDQALYGFREAKKDFIRNLHDNDNDFENLYLPFCSRCTPVVVEATNKVIEVAQTQGLLEGRISREFISYWPDKYKEHSIYPKLCIAKCSQLDTVGKYIQTKILRITQE
jgi:superfamily I DNA/RNA helicase